MEMNSSLFNLIDHVTKTFLQKMDTLSSFSFFFLTWIICVPLFFIFLFPYIYALSPFFQCFFFLVHLDSFLSYSGLSSLLFILKGNFWGFFFIVQASTQITSCLIRPFLPYYSSWKETSRASFYCSGIRLDNFLSYQADSGSLFLTIHHKRRLLWHLFTV